MKNNGKTLRTRIADLDGTLELTEAELSLVAGGLKIGLGGGGFGGGVVVAENKCWQASSSATSPGNPDTAQDWVVD